MWISLHLSKAQIHLIGLTRSTFIVATANAELKALPSRPIIDELPEKMGMSSKSRNPCSWLQHEWILANFSGLRSGFYYIILCDWQRSWSRPWKDKVATKKWSTLELLSRSRVNLYYMASLISVETPKSYYATNFLLFSQCLIFTFPFGLAKFPSPILLPFLNSPLLHAIRPGIVSLSIETFFWFTDINSAIWIRVGAQSVTWFIDWILSSIF